MTSDAQSTRSYAIGPSPAQRRKAMLQATATALILIGAGIACLPVDMPLTDRAGPILLICASLPLLFMAALARMPSWHVSNDNERLILNDRGRDARHVIRPHDVIGLYWTPSEIRLRTGGGVFRFANDGFTQDTDWQAVRQVVAHLLGDRFDCPLAMPQTSLHISPLRVAIGVGLGVTWIGLSMLIGWQFRPWPGPFLALALMLAPLLWLTIRHSRQHAWQK